MNHYFDTPPMFTRRRTSLISRIPTLVLLTLLLLLTLPQGIPTAV